MARRHVFDGPTGNLDARIHGSGRPVLVLHPHPLHGGTKGTLFVYRICEALAQAGFEATRFDFRGAGDSEGEYDHGSGETEDALRVWDAVHAASDVAPAVVGFSFGGGVAVRVAGQRPVPALVLVGTPAQVRDSDLAPGVEGTDVTCPTVLVYGTEDEHVSRSGAEAVQAAIGGSRIHALEGADHFLTPTHHERGVAAVVKALQELL